MPQSSRVLALLTCLLAVFGLAFAGAPGASAHDRLLSSSPAAGSTVTGPKQVTLTFNAELLKTGSRVQVSSPSGADIATGAATLEGRTVTQSLSSASAGRYTVTWRVTSSDGHPISGRFSFTVRGAASSTSAPASGQSSDSTSSADESVPPLGGGATSGTTSATSSTPFNPGRKVDTNATRNQPWVILGLTGAALIVVIGGVLYARRRVGNDE